MPSAVFFVIDDISNFNRPAPKPKRIQLDKRTNEPVKSVTTKFNAVNNINLLLIINYLNHNCCRVETGNGRDAFTFGVNQIHFHL